ncbi:hypothetical protein F5I97DRAFT_31810 [Phlebopus sp. FC_14]|nr:hypothetical protein F5I97DRAFT_31810 [Phlebopus sp. FC_14]
MLLYPAFIAISLAPAILSIPFDFRVKRDVDPSLVPPFGWQAGVNPDGTGNCDGAVNGTNGKPIEVPCQCPPNSTFFLAALNKNVAAGYVTTNPTVLLTFPTDNSTASQLARLNAAAVTLQNLEGPGVGCPISSTTYGAQQKAIEAEGTNPTSSAGPSSSTPFATGIVATASSTASACPGPVTVTQYVTVTPAAAPPQSSAPSSSAAPSAVPTTASGGNSTSGGNTTSPTDAQIATLAPPLGWTSGINPDGTGNCDGAVNGTNGKPILIPCQCPPDQSNYIANLTLNIRAGHVVLNPTVLVTFPTDNSTTSQNARLYAAAVTLQNLNGPGKGCPISSTNFTAQQQAINAEGSG